MEVRLPYWSFGDSKLMLFFIKNADKAKLKVSILPPKKNMTPQPGGGKRARLQRDELPAFASSRGGC